MKIRDKVQNLAESVRKILAAGVGAIVATTVNGLAVETGTVAGSNPASVTYYRFGSFYFAIGSTTPTSVDLPVGTYYFTGGASPQFWLKYAAAATAWTSIIIPGTANPSFVGLTVTGTSLPLLLDTGVSESSYLAVAISANQTDMNIATPHVMSRFNRYLVTPDANRTIFSINVPNGGYRLGFWIVNASPTATLTLAHDDGATGTAAQRFYCPNNANVAIRPNGAVFVWYDTAASRYRVAGI